MSRPSILIVYLQNEAEALAAYERGAEWVLTGEIGEKAT
jgi:hypothetical protein